MDNDEGAPEGRSAGLPRARKAARNDAVRITPNKNRIVQVAKSGGRKLFGKERKEAFLEWFAATCNVRFSAARAGVHEKTVYKHLLKDPAFEEAFGRALRLGYARLEARLMQEATPSVIASDAKQSSLDRHGSGEPRDDGKYEVRAGLDGAEVEEQFDPQLALHLLREHKRRLSGPGGKRKNLRTTARVATNAEVIVALTKRLKAFAVRVGGNPVPVRAEPVEALPFPPGNQDSPSTSSGRADS